MGTDSMFEILNRYGITNKSEYISQAFARNIGLLTMEEQKKLSYAKVAIPGMGGVGGVHLITLVRTGIGRFHIADFDIYEPANINRQFGARVPDFGRAKLEVMKEQALSINPYLELSIFNEGINESNMDSFLDGVDVVIDSLDFFQFDIRRVLFKRAAEKGIHVITAGPMGFSSAMLIFSPYGMGFDEYFNITDGMADKDKYLSFALGLAPRPTHIKYMNLKKVDLDSKAGPSLNIACQICSGMAATEALKIILGRGRVKSVPYYFQYDPYLQKFRKGCLFMGNRNPLQKIKMQVVKFMLEKNKQIIKPEIPEKPTIQIMSGDGEIPESVIDYLIKAGIQAPSGDNAQPWKFGRNRNQIELYLDKDKDLSFFNVNQIASLISCGAVLENIKIAASSLNIGVEIKYKVNIIESDLVASIKLIQGKVNKDELSDFIWKRHTNRKFYEKKSVSSSVLQKMESSIENIPGAKLHFITNKEDLKKLGKIIYQVDRIRTEHRGLHEHLMKMIRFSNEDALEKRDGLPLKNLEAGFAGEQFLKATKQWAIMNIVNKTGIGRMVALHSYKGIVNSSGVALLTVDGMKDQDFVLGGQALERVWLTISSIGLVMQPMTAITLFYQRLSLKDGKKDFQKRHQEVLNNSHDIYKELFPCLKESSTGQVLLFRFGYAEDVHCRTLRTHIK